MNDIITNRLSCVRFYLREKVLDCLLVSQADNRRYLSGFVGSAGTLLITQQRAILTTDFRYVEQAKTQAPHYEVIQIKGELANWLPELASSLNIDSLGFEAEDISYASYTQLAEAISKNSSIKLVPTQKIILEIRAQKDPREVKLIRQAVALADEAFAHIYKFLRPGLSEKVVAWELERFLREKGSEAIPFDIIVASGVNAALPHHHSSERLIQAGEPIIVDLGAKINGYSSDLTRTFCLGAPNDTYKNIYGIVLHAQQNAIDHIKPDITGGQSDAFCRSIIEAAGFGYAFGHGTGHGIGVAVHEEPRLGPGVLAPIKSEMVFTIEPGIYLPGWGGVRIEDDVYLISQNLQILSQPSRYQFVGIENSIIPI